MKPLRILLLLMVATLCVSCVSNATHRTASATSRIPHSHGILYEASF
jgi:hypothetical protein